MIKRYLSKIVVIGAGQMGSGIAYVSAVRAKKDTVLVDQPSVLEKAEKYFDELLKKEATKNKLHESLETIKSRIHFNSGVENAVHSADFVIEAIPEHFELKQDLFKKIDKNLPKHAIIASNTSSIPITKLAAITSRPDKVIGQHFMNPVPVLKLCEIIRGLQTSDDTYNKTVELTTLMMKTITTSMDVPGFIANRLLCPYINEAIIALEQGVGTKEDIDNTMTLGMAHPMGPLKLADLIGLDTVLNIMNILHAELGDKYRPATLLKSLVSANRLGRKSGHGFYIYNK
eukprot:NODE_149_length_17312_cov_0.399349.p7 type:complete len:287 gc:universal NODE_149_length_17312_cov_0.399349:11652-12512(+)